MVINASDLESSVFDTSSLIDINKYYSILNNKVGRFIFFKYTVNRLTKANKAIDRIASDFKNLKVSLDQEAYEDLVDILDNMIEHNEETKISFNNIELFTDSQKKVLNEIFKNFFKKAIKAKSYLSANFYKGKPKVDDSYLRKLIITNNNLQLAKKL